MPGEGQTECGGQASSLGQNSRTRNIWPTTEMRLLKTKQKEEKVVFYGFCKRNVDEEGRGVLQVNKEEKV